MRRLPIHRHTVHTQTHWSTLLDHKEKVVGHKTRRDYAARHQRGERIPLLLHISQVACSDQGEPLAFSFHRADRLSYLEQLERETSPQANKIPVDTPEMYVMHWSGPGDTSHTAEPHRPHGAA